MDKGDLDAQTNINGGTITTMNLERLDGTQLQHACLRRHELDVWPAVQRLQSRPPARETRTSTCCNPGAGDSRIDPIKCRT